MVSVRAKRDGRDTSTEAHRDGLARLDEEERVGDVALAHDRLAVAEALFLKDRRHRGALLVRQPLWWHGAALVNRQLRL